MRVKYLFIFIIIMLIMSVYSCNCSMETERLDLNILFPNQGEYKGWEIDINGNNTGLKGDHSNLTALTPTSVGYLNAGVLYVTASNITISNKQIQYPVIMQNNSTGVIFDKCLVQPTSCGLGSPIVQAVNTNTTFRDCEFDFDGIPIEQVNLSIGIVVVNGIIERCNVYGSSTGISIHNTSNTMVSIAEGNFVHDLRYYEPPAHIDGITIRKSWGMGTIIRNNRIITDSPDGTTGACFLKPLEGFINNVLIQGNLFEGYGTNLWLENSNSHYGSNMVAIDNRFNAYQGQGWYTFVDGGPGWYQWSENYIDDPVDDDHKGAVIPEPNP